ncbi:MAG: XRE family transcriptional regulator [Bacteroidetes bacterium GWE2_39_28]|nr:MAG: XRE family transcriptional regulator [Bacteroidetes bacterium GWE2_39_28]OFY13227.1 MAG: XRE family transcriptional regulator [Bacteroidetes bacterium GWF2_39_10]OFZ09895.1 MAG: XRE family transcriptional regulator [Bacteroidetes bacterium RIFOXYC2_FULL_39_11]HCT94324.1 XRE family transcriptional regulator [Rikenellaceae bacterium]
MICIDLQSKVQEIKDNDKEFKITPRELINAFGCEKRTSGNRAYINKYLQDNQLETFPDYMNAWIDGEIVLRHKKRAKSKSGADPIQRIKILSAANKEPITVTRDAELVEATTLMMLHNYSQLPVISSPKTLVGFISWGTIGSKISNGVQSDKISDYYSKDIAVIDYEKPLLEAIKIIIDKEFAVIQKSDKTISGIVTIADISEQFVTITEPFLLLEQIENHIRQVLDGKFLLDELIDFCKNGDQERKLEHIDDLTFGDYIRIIEKPEHWEKLNLSLDRSHFIKQLEKVRNIRNDIMHFNPEGITESQRVDLTKMAGLLMTIIEYVK